MVFTRCKRRSGVWTFQIWIQDNYCEVFCELDSAGRWSVLSPDLTNVSKIFPVMYHCFERGILESIQKEKKLFKAQHRSDVFSVTNTQI